ncbi:C-type lectin domain family 4 member G-like [Tympanuchus pallidicinctus]|uniref:C-type lectin domain family 4 member G-like n=2 Tax=Tetraoninae TaxID=466585 RepID=UPI002286DBFF|nr:C-type lectin domain family 4 member G-like [Tympanuchus pallidicinctus]
MGQGRAGWGWQWGSCGAPLGLWLLLGAAVVAWGLLLGTLLGRHAALSQEIQRLRDTQRLLENNGSALAAALAMLEGNQTQLKKHGTETAALLELLSANQSATRLEVSGTMVSVWRERSTTRSALHQLLHALWALNRSSCQVCPPGWRLHGGSCYMVGSGAVGWAQAQGRCRDSGAQLVVIGDAQEQEFLTSLAPPYETWIGLHDRSTEGSFQWVDGSALSFRNWRWGQPDEAGGGEDCVAMDSRGGWGDRPCAVSLGGWVCERGWGC